MNEPIAVTLLLIDNILRGPVCDAFASVGKQQRIHGFLVVARGGVDRREQRRVGAAAQRIL
jgi:hypothetical protein